MKRQLKIIATMIAIVISMFLFVWLLLNYEKVMLLIFIGVILLIGLAIFYGGVSSFFEEED